MPQLILEHSSNIFEKDDLFDILNHLNSFLSEKLPTELASCKSRSVEYQTYCIGDGSQNNAFIHINLKVMPGRSLEKLNDVGKSMMDILKQYFCKSAKQLNLQITIEISELQKTYYKYVS